MKRLLTLVISIIVIIACQYLLAQESNITFEHYSIDQGMYETNIFTIIQDRTGYLWFGTWGGIERYDGYNFKAYRKELDNPNSIQTQFVSTLYEDKEGNIWVGTEFGLEKFNKITGNFSQYLPYPPNTEPESNNFVSSICEDKFGMLWIGTRDGLYNFDKKSEKFICIRNNDKNPESIGSNDISAILEDKAGSIWFGNSKGLDKLDRKTGSFIHIWNDPNNKSEWTNYFVNTLFEDKSGILWLGTRKGLVAFDQKEGTFTPYIKEEGNSISSICEDASGHLWFGSWVSGLYSFDKKSKKFTHYLHNENDPGSLSSNTVTSICYERSGTIWIATRGAGVNKINRIKQPFKKYLFNEVSHIIKANNDMIWIGTSKGWKKFNPKTEELIPYSFGKDFLIAEEESGDLWLAKESGGIYKRDVKNRITNYYDSSGREFDKIVNRVYKTPDGMVWIGTIDGGVYKIAPNGNLIRKILETGWVMDFYLDSSGLLWIGSIESALICYDPAKNIVVNKFYYDPGNPGSIKSNVVFKILEDNAGVLYFATNKGLGIYNRSTKEFNFFNERNGLPHDMLWSFLGDDVGNFWIVTRKGISKFNTNTKQFQNYDVSYGLPENGFYLNGACKTRNGEMYFGSPNAVVRFQPDSIKNNPFIPPIEITTIRKFEESVPIGKEIDLSYKENFLSIEFIALSYISPERNQFAYKMEGVDTGWVYSGTRHYASYPNLDPGEYIFRVKGSNNDGVWNEEGTSIAIIISAPWWETWWFRIFVFVVLLTTIGGIIRYIEMKKIKRKIEMLEQERALERERTRISRDMHDEVGSSLSEIVILSELAKKKPGEAEQHIKEISDRAAEVIDNVSEIVWAMNPQNDKLDNLIAHTRRYAVKYLGLANISCQFMVPEIIPASPLSAELTRNIFLVVKETLHNIVKHSCASEVTFTIDLLNQQLNIKIKDNGKGFSLDESTGLGNGLLNMRRRIEDISGVINIESTYGKGTQINFTVQINN